MPHCPPLAPPKKKTRPPYEPSRSYNPFFLNLALEGVEADSALLWDTQWHNLVNNAIADITLSGRVLTVTMPWPNRYGKFEYIERNDTVEILQTQYWSELRIGPHSADICTTLRGISDLHFRGGGPQWAVSKVTVDGISHEFDWQRADTPTVVFRRGPWGRLMLKTD